MARNTGPRGRRARRLFVGLSNLTEKHVDKDPSQRRPYPPGQHGPTLRFKQSEYGQRLMEKQKLKLVYEVLERQLVRYVTRAKRKRANPALELATLLESRLDALVWRAGFATSVRQARQFVRHGYFTVDGQKSNFPGTELRPGAVVALRERFRGHPLLTEVLARTNHRGRPAHIALTTGSVGFSLVTRPEPTPPIQIDLPRVIELYA